MPLAIYSTTWQVQKFLTFVPTLLKYSGLSGKSGRILMWYFAFCVNPPLHNQYLGRWNFCAFSLTRKNALWRWLSNWHLLALAIRSSKSDQPFPQSPVFNWVLAGLDIFHPQENEPLFALEILLHPPSPRSWFLQTEPPCWHLQQPRPSTRYLQHSWPTTSWGSFFAAFPPVHTAKQTHARVASSPAHPEQSDQQHCPPDRPRPKNTRLSLAHRARSDRKLYNPQ